MLENGQFRLRIPALTGLVMNPAATMTQTITTLLVFSEENYVTPKNYDDTDRSHIIGIFWAKLRDSKKSLIRKFSILRGP